MNRPDDEQRKILRQISWFALLLWLASLAAFIFGDFRSRVVPTAVAFIVTVAYFAARATFNMKK